MTFRCYDSLMRYQYSVDASCSLIDAIREAYYMAHEHQITSVEVYDGDNFIARVMTLPGRSCVLSRQKTAKRLVKPRRPRRRSNLSIQLTIDL